MTTPPCCGGQPLPNGRRTAKPGKCPKFDPFDGASIRKGGSAPDLVRPATESGDKLTRFGPFSSQCRAGNVRIRRGSWNEELFRVLEGFPDLAHDDEVDACSGALEMLNPQMKGWGIYKLYEQQAAAAAESSKPQPVQNVPQPGSTEWFQAQQKKNG